MTLEANYMFLRTTQFFWLSYSSAIQHQWVMATETPQTGVRRSQLSEIAGFSFNASLKGTNQCHRPQLFHREDANVATDSMTIGAHLKNVRKTDSCTNKEKHAIGGGNVHILVHCGQLIY